MLVNRQIFILALAALVIVGIVCIGLLAILAISILQRRDNQQVTIAPTATNSKQIANSTVAMSAGISAIILAANYIVPHTSINKLLFGGIGIVGFVAIIYAWNNFRHI